MKKHKNHHTEHLDHHKHHNNSRYCCRAPSFFGIFLVILGAFLLLKKLGITIPYISVIGQYWPIGLILTGFAWIFKKRGLGFTILLLTAIFGMIYHLSSYDAPLQNAREVNLIKPADAEIKKVDLRLNFGAGEVSISGSTNNILEQNVRTNLLKDPRIDYDKNGDEMEIYIERNHPSSIPPNAKEEWSLLLNPELTHKIRLSYGAADMDIDLTDLKTDELRIESGASDTKITFGNYPTKTRIESGVSSIVVRYPKDMQIKISTEGLIDTNVRGLSFDSEWYQSENFDPEKPFIELDIEGGFVSLDVEEI